MCHRTAFRIWQLLLADLCGVEDNADGSVALSCHPIRRLAVMVQQLGAVFRIPLLLLLKDLHWHPTWCSDLHRCRSSADNGQSGFLPAGRPPNSCPQASGRASSVRTTWLRASGSAAAAQRDGLGGVRPPAWRRTGSEVLVGDMRRMPLPGRAPTRSDRQDSRCWRSCRAIMLPVCWWPSGAPERACPTAATWCGGGGHVSWMTARTGAGVADRLQRAVRRIGPPTRIASSVCEAG
mmetsp:Transcript_80502/g.239916  ORF Transcript_80502/g.239916 Transcript_80502/m.239916 type:complete len:236 (-) Transcript_80502:8-715(-)